MVFLGLCVFITALFAASLSHMEFQPGLPSPLLESDRIVVPDTARADPINLSVFPLILRLVGILLAIYLLITKGQIFGNSPRFSLNYKPLG